MKIKIPALLFAALAVFTLNLLLLKYHTAIPITNPERSDGFGAQFQTIIYAAIYAELTHRNFVYTPFVNMEHNYDNDQEFIRKKEQLINLQDNFKTAKKNLNLQKFNVRHYIKFFEKNIDRCYRSQTLKRIKQLFRANKKEDFFGNNKFNIAVHIRRPNSHDTRLAGADVPDSKFIYIINYLKQIYADKDYVIHLYSQGDVNLFKQYTDIDRHIILHLNESIENTFTGLVYADVLVLSPSSLSYTAGLLSDGQVYYMPFWHPPLPGWKVI